MALTLGGNWRMPLPAEQRGQGQERLAVASIEPETDVVQGHLGGQTGQEAVQLVRSFRLATERTLQSPDDRLHDLPLTRQPAALVGWPAVATAALRGSDDLGVGHRHPLLLADLPSEAAVRHI